MTVNVVALLIAVAAGVLIPLLNSLLVKLDASPFLKSLVTMALAALTAVSMWVLSVGDLIDWKQMAVVALTAIIAAGGIRTAVTGGLEHKIALATKDFGISNRPAVSPPGTQPLAPPNSHAGAVTYGALFFLFVVVAFTVVLLLVV